MGCGGSVAKPGDQAKDTSAATADESKQKGEAATATPDESKQKGEAATATPDESKQKGEAATATTETEPSTDAKSTQSVIPLPTETLQIAKKVGDIALIRAQDSVTAAVRSWPPDNQSG